MSLYSCYYYVWEYAGGGFYTVEDMIGFGYDCTCVEDFSVIMDIYGCTDSSACNYDSESFVDDGSCEYNSGTWYVSTDGDNGNCGSEEYPFASIQYAIDMTVDGDSVMAVSYTHLTLPTILLV